MSTHNVIFPLPPEHNTETGELNKREVTGVRNFDSVLGLLLSLLL